MVERSVDFLEEVMVDIWLVKMKYFFLLKEVKYWNILINRML